ncbi:hypothetical protein L9F63_017760, partial [Diploptera punctata]
SKGTTHSSVVIITTFHCLLYTLQLYGRTCHIPNLKNFISQTLLLNHTLVVLGLVSCKLWKSVELEAVRCCHILRRVKTARNTFRPMREQKRTGLPQNRHENIEYGCSLYS